MTVEFASAVFGNMPINMIIFGGTFDPVHFGHLICARCIAEQFGFDRITLVPAANPPHKNLSPASAEHRIAMLELATEGDDLFDVCSLEIGRAGPSYTIDTVEELKNRQPSDASLKLIMGLDMLMDLPHWHRADELVGMVEIITALRPPLEENLSSARLHLRKTFPTAIAERLINSIAETPLIDISATDIRERIRCGKSVRYLLPKTVEEYIEKYEIYRPAEDK